MLLKACLNGARAVGEHPALPVTAAAMAREARRAVDAGAGALHVHPRRDDGRESLADEVISATVGAVRVASPGVAVGVSTGAWIEPEVGRRVALVRRWGALDPAKRPDFASVNLEEAGSAEVIAACFAVGVGVEAGISTAGDARLLVDLGVGARCVRVLIEMVGEQTVADARATVEEVVGVLDAARVGVPRLLHGEGAIAWPMLDEALARGYDTRIGLEDTLELPDGSRAADNAALVREARARAVRAGRVAQA